MADGDGRHGLPRLRYRAEGAHALGIEARHLVDGEPEADGLEGDLRRETSMNIKRLMDLGCYRGLRHRKGLPVRGWKLVAKRASRSWHDEERALKFMAKAGIPAGERHVKKVLSPAQTEAALKRNKLPADLPLQFMKQPLVKKESSGTTLAKDSDPRPAVLLAGDALKALADRLSAR